MKRISILIVIYHLAANCMAQDVIITLESKRIEAKVTEITEQQVSYQLKNDPDKKIWQMGLSRIATIFFENGDVFVPATQPISELQSSEYEEDNFRQDESDMERIITLSSGETIIYRSGTQIESTNNGLYYGGYKFRNAKDFDSFLEQTCPSAYQEKKEANRLMNLSIIPIFPALGFLSVGLYYNVRPLFNGSMLEENYDEWNDAVKPALAWYVLGIGCMCIGLPLATKATKHEENARVIFNHDCAHTPSRTTTAQLSFTISPIAAGLSLTF